MKEIEFRLVSMTLKELMPDDEEEMVTDVSEQDVTEPVFQSNLKSYRVFEGMTVTFHCKVSGHPMPKVCFAVFHLR